MDPTMSTTESSFYEAVKETGEAGVVILVFLVIVILLGFCYEVFCPRIKRRLLHSPLVQDEEMEFDEQNELELSELRRPGDEERLREVVSHDTLPGYSSVPTDPVAPGDPFRIKLTPPTPTGSSPSTPLSPPDPNLLQVPKMTSVRSKARRSREAPNRPEPYQIIQEAFKKKESTETEPEPEEETTSKKKKKE